MYFVFIYENRRMKPDESLLRREGRLEEGDDGGVKSS
jgi:hypothetical protein